MVIKSKETPGVSGMIDVYRKAAMLDMATTKIDLCRHLVVNQPRYNRKVKRRDLAFSNVKKVRGHWSFYCHTVSHCEWRHTHIHMRLQRRHPGHPPPRTARSSGQPSLPRDQVQVPGPVLVRDRTEEHLFFCMFLLWGSMGGTRVTRGEHANSTQKGPGTSPDMLHHAGLEPTTFLL